MQWQALLALYLFASGMIVAPVSAVPAGWEAGQVAVYASDGFSQDRLGSSLASSGDLVVAGAENKETSVPNAGVAYVWRRDSLSGLSFVTRLQASDPDNSDYFGRSVGIDGDIIAVGAPGDDGVGHAAPSTGAVYVFRRDAGSGDWNFEQKLYAEDPAENSEFGHAVEVFGSTIAVGAHLDDDPGANAGVVYIFHYDTSWNQTTKLYDASVTLFGASLDYHSDLLVIGASDHRAYVYRRNFPSSWTLLDTMERSVGTGTDFYANAVAVHDRVIAVATYYEDIYGNNAGLVNVYHESASSSNDWVETAQIAANDTAEDDQFGWSLALADTHTLVVGARWNDNGYGSVYVFEDTGSAWEETAQIWMDYPNDYDLFGSAVAVMGDGTLVVGAPEHDGQRGQYSSQGSIYLMSSTGCPEDQQRRASDGECEPCLFQAVSVLGQPCHCYGDYVYDETAGCVSPPDSDDPDNDKSNSPSLPMVALIAGSAGLGGVIIGLSVGVMLRRGGGADHRNSLAKKKESSSNLTIVTDSTRVYQASDPSPSPSEASAMTAASVMTADSEPVPRKRSKPHKASGSRGTKQSYGRRGTAEQPGFTSQPISAFGPSDIDDGRSVATVTSEMAPYMPDHV